MKASHLFAVLASVLWGVSYTVEERVLRSADPLTVILCHSILSVAVLLPLWFYLNQKGEALQVISNDPQWPRWLLGAFAVGLAANFCIFTSIKLAGSEIAAALEISYPIFTAIFAMILFGRQPTKELLFGGLLIFVGSLIVMRSGSTPT